MMAVAKHSWLNNRSHDPVRSTVTVKSAYPGWRGEWSRSEGQDSMKQLKDKRCSAGRRQKKRMQKEEWGQKVDGRENDHG